MARDDPRGARRPATTVMIVRRGRDERHELLTQQFGASGVEIIWDRRQGERRRRDDSVPENLRRADRRRPPPALWSTMDFLVSERTDESSRVE